VSSSNKQSRLISSCLIPPTIASLSSNKQSSSYPIQTRLDQPTVPLPLDLEQKRSSSPFSSYEIPSPVCKRSTTTQPELKVNRKGRCRQGERWCRRQFAAYKVVHDGLQGDCFITSALIRSYAWPQAIAFERDPIDDIMSCTSHMVPVFLSCWPRKRVWKFNAMQNSFFNNSTSLFRQQRGRCRWCSLVSPLHHVLILGTHSLITHRRNRRKWQKIYSTNVPPERREHVVLLPRLLILRYLIHPLENLDFKGRPNCCC
jgi:hypothetical protein